MWKAIALDCESSFVASQTKTSPALFSGLLQILSRKGRVYVLQHWGGAFQLSVRLLLLVFAMLITMNCKGQLLVMLSGTSNCWWKELFICGTLSDESSPFAPVTGGHSYPVPAGIHLPLHSKVWPWYICEEVNGVGWEPGLFPEPEVMVKGSDLGQRVLFHLALVIFF